MPAAVPFTRANGQPGMQMQPVDVGIQHFGQPIDVSVKGRPGTDREPVDAAQGRRHPVGRRVAHDDRDQPLIQLNRIIELGPANSRRAGVRRDHDHDIVRRGYRSPDLVHPRRRRRDAGYLGTFALVRMTCVNDPAPAAPSPLGLTALGVSAEDPMTAAGADVVTAATDSSAATSDTPVGADAVPAAGVSAAGAPAWGAMSRSRRSPTSMKTVLPRLLRPSQRRETISMSRRE